MAIFLDVPSAAYVNPVVSTVGGLHDELVEVGVVLEVVKTLLGDLHVGM